MGNHNKGKPHILNVVLYEKIIPKSGDAAMIKDFLEILNWVSTDSLQVRVELSWKKFSFF